MKLLKFSFKYEPIWMVVFSFAPGLLTLLIVLLLTQLALNKLAIRNLKFRYVYRNH